MEDGAMGLARWLSIVLATALLASCAARPQHTVPIALLVDGDPAAVGALPTHAVDGLELHPVELPAPAPAPPDPSASTITRARSSYARGDFDACRRELATIDHVRLLAARERTLVARALVLDAACGWGALDKAAAQTTAARLASFSLELPDLGVSPDVERMLGDAIAAAGKAKRSPLAVTGVVGARLSVDGIEAGCALPCTIDLGPGDHVLAVEADGFQPAVQRVRVPQARELAIAQQPASAELAAKQWRARVGRGQPATDVVGAALLGKLGKQTRVAFVHGDTRLTGALVVGGTLVATATGSRNEGADLVRELAYDGGVLHRPSLWQRPWFWIAATGAVALVAGAIVAVTYEPDKHTRLVVP
jgi:hypothetical protein